MTVLAWLCIVTAVLILQLALGVGIGRAIRLADKRESRVSPVDVEQVPR